MADVSRLTRVEDVLIPDVWNQYFQEQTAELSLIRTSGIAATASGITVPRGGTTINMPFWQDLDGDDEVWSSGHETVPDKMTSNKDMAAILTRIKSWGAEDLAGMFAGSDPMAAIGRMVGGYWARREQRILLAILQGVFSSASMTDNLVDASAVNISHELLVDAISAMGDASTKLTGILTHSAVQFDLAKKRLLDQKPTEPGTNTAPEFSTFLGRQIIVDDGAPRTGDVYTTYLFGAGAVAYAEGSPKVPVEVQREGTRSLDILINRREFILHPKGVRWVGDAANDTPSNAELTVGTNWNRVFENKNIPIIALKHRIG